MRQAETRQSSRSVATKFGRSLALRILAALVLIAFICVLGDIRRKNNAMLQAQRYATAMSARLEGGGSIPLNLDPSEFVVNDDKPINLEWLSRDDARCLRGRSSRMFVAWTSPLPLVLGTNGRAVVLMDAGRVRAEWISVNDFSREFSAQEEVIRSCPPSTPDQ